MEKKIDRILQYVHEQRNYDFRGNHLSMLQRRINKRVYTTKTNSFNEYYNYLVANHQEMDELIDVLTINVSGFFRDPLIFEYLYNLISNIIQEKLRNSNHNLRIWSAGCSTGEEPYTLAIILSEILKKTLDSEISIDIIGTDIDITALICAKTGHYQKESLKDIKFGLVSEYFALEKNYYCISKKIKKMVSFSKYDLLDKKSFVPPESVFGDFDIVFCRNVLIYFNQEYQEFVFNKLYRSLHKNGYLILGEAEIPVEQYKNKFRRIGSKVKPVFQQDENLWIAGVDKGQIEQVFSNFTINAKEAMPDGGHLFVTLENVKIADSSIAGLNVGKYIKVTIRDEGMGIPNKLLNRVFDPYFTTKQTGNGLGLATVYSIIHKHKGSIHIDSKINYGTTFTFYLPASDGQQKKEPALIKTKNEPLNHAVTILVMDDEKAIREIVSILLREIGFSVETVEGGQQAVDRYREAMVNGEPFGAVVMDLTIPGGIGGKEAVRSILEIDPDAKVIVSSGYAENPIVANYADYGFKGVAVKPYSIDTLQETLYQVLQSE